MARTAEIKRKTNETEIELKLNLDGTGKSDCKTGVGFLDHMLDHFAKHSISNLYVRATGDLHVDDHHTVEDIAICLGEAIEKALGDKKGIFRYGQACVPMDEALADVAIDLSGRAAFIWNVPFTSDKIGSMDTQLLQEFCSRLASVAKMNLHVNVHYGSNDHHIAEAIFKALAMALRNAKTIDPFRSNEVPSTKGTL